MAFTRHGHQVEGTAMEPRSSGRLPSACGGPDLCPVCKADSAAIRAGVQAAETKAPKPKLTEQDIRAEALARAERMWPGASPEGLIKMAKRLEDYVQDGM